MAKKRAPAHTPQMRMIRATVGTSYPMHPEDVGIIHVPDRVARAMLDTGQAVPVCGVAREVQIAALCSAAHALGVTLGTSDAEIVAAAAEYGATVSGS